MRVTFRETCHGCKEERIFQIEVSDLQYVRFSESCPKCGAYNPGTIRNFERTVVSMPRIFGEDALSRYALVNSLVDKEK